MSSVRMGGSPNIKKIKRVVQGIVDQILTEETSLIGLTTIRDYDEYTFTHSVNVCIFSVALGKRLGLTKLQLYDLGMAALFHDIGKSRVPQEVLNKTTGLTDDEWRMIASASVDGRPVAVPNSRHAGAAVSVNDCRARAPHEARSHWLSAVLRERTISVFSKIVAIADSFDAATSRRAYQTVPFTPAQVMARDARQSASRHGPSHRQGVHQPHRHLSGWHAGRTGYVRAGNRSRGEPAPRHAVASRSFASSATLRATCSIPERSSTSPTAMPEGVFLRTIIKTENPERYGIRVGDYFI